MIRLLADENVPRRSVSLLREAGFDVAVVASGAADEAILARAVAEDRVLLTLDRDFGRLALLQRAGGMPGIVYVRLPHSRPETCARVLLPLLRDPALVLEGRFTAVRPARIRQIPLQPHQ